MSSSTLNLASSTAILVEVTEDAIAVQLSDGRTVSAPLSWYPRLCHASKVERDNWRLLGSGTGIHWPSIDEDISIENLLSGKASGESQKSFQSWLASRA